MKLSLRLFVILFFTALIASAQPSSVFEKANNLYQAKKYPDAIKSYTSILDNGYESPELYYNLGNAYFKTGKIGFAILYYEKALKLNPGDEDVLYNLRLAKARTEDKINEVPKIFIAEWWEIFVSSLSVNGWSILVSAFFILFIICVGLYYFTKSRLISRISFIGGFAGLTAFIAASIILFSAVHKETTSDYGILTTKVQSAKVSPDPGSNDSFVIHEGVKFLVNDKVGEWYKIKLADGKIGWLPKGVFEMI